MNLRPRTISLAKRSHFLFDLDGTLVDSTPLHARAYLATIAEASKTKAAAFDYSRISGKTTRSAFIELGFDAAHIDRLVAAKQLAYLASIEAGEISPFDGARDLLERLCSRGITCYLVTSASRRSTDRVLRATGLGAYFRRTVTGDDVQNSKPAPDGYASIVNQYALTPSDCIVIEDAPAGLISARAAGLDSVCVNVPKGRPAPNEASLSCASLAALLAALERAWT